MRSPSGSSLRSVFCTSGLPQKVLKSIDLPLELSWIQLFVLGSKSLFDLTVDKQRLKESLIGSLRLRVLFYDFAPHPGLALKLHRRQKVIRVQTQI